MDPYDHDDQGAFLRAVLDGLQNGGNAASPGGLGTALFSGQNIRALAALLAAGNRSAYYGEGEEDDDDDEYISMVSDDEESYHDYSYFAEEPPLTEPDPKGQALLNSGEFGPPGAYQPPSARETRNSRSVLRPGIRPSNSAKHPSAPLGLVPNTNGTTVASYPENMYTATFSDDSSFYYTCAQDFRLHIFDMTKPPRPFGRPEGASSHIKATMPLRKEIAGVPGRWTITDANLSPDNTRIIYSSIHPTVFMTSTAPEGSSAQIPIRFDDPADRGWRGGFGIWSCRFSADGNEVVAGGDGKLFVYDLLSDRRIVKIDAHADDINSCCWADVGSGNVLVSASDDSYLKVWDRRSLASKKPSGVLMGHTEGITYVSPKGDGRYVISNGKDQTLRLWDLRQMRSSQDLEDLQGVPFGVRGFDYRYPPYPRRRSHPHPKDCSVMTYRGHSVMRTLIRCHFSPAETTGNQYLYSGSADGRIHIWSLDGRVVQVLDRSKTLPPTFSPSGPEPAEIRSRHSCCVRDVSWHSQEPVMMSAAWEASGAGTAIARHEWKGLSKFRGRLEDWTERRLAEEEDRFRARRASRLSNLRDTSGIPARHYMPGAYDTDSGSDDEDDSTYEDE